MSILNIKCSNCQYGRGECVMKQIPISVAKGIAKEYGYEQVIILGMKKSACEGGIFRNHATTYNTDKDKCSFLGKVARILAHNFRYFYNDTEETELKNKIINNLEKIK